MADSLKIYDILKTAFPEAETRAVTKAIEISHFETASQSDVRAAVLELRAEIKTAVAQAEVRLLRWMFIFWVGQVGVTVATLLTAIHVLKN